MAFDAVRLVGQKRAGLAMAITGYLVSIPVFSDAAFVILTPLVKAIHKKTRISLAILAVSLSAGLLSTHVFVAADTRSAGSSRTSGNRYWARNPVWCIWCVLYDAGRLDLCRNLFPQQAGFLLQFS